jgi:hypothetical protein
MKKILILILLNVGININTNGQASLTTMISKDLSDTKEKSTKKSVKFEFKAYSTDNGINNIPEGSAGNHILGDIIARKLFLFQELYTDEVEVVPGNPQTKTVIKKPVIYDAVMRIDKYYRKAAKKDKLLIVSAQNNMNLILDIAMNIMSADTDEFDKAIKSSPDTVALISLFTEQTKLIY